MKPTRYFEYRNNELYCEETSLASIAESFGTPCYVYSRKTICRNLETLQEAFPADFAHICFAVKANSNLSILELLAAHGTGFDIVSSGELYRLRRLGVPGSRVIFSGVGKRIDEIDWAIKAKIFSLGVESIEELKMIAARVETLRTGAAVSLRLNLDIEAETHPGISTGRKIHKFGLDADFLPEAAGIIKESPLLKLKGVGSHIGSQILDTSPYIILFNRLRECAAALDRSGFSLEFLDIGGGFGIPYDDHTEPFRLEELSRYIAENRGNYQVVLEPGRFIVGSSGVLLSRVTLRKVTGGRRFVILDAGMNDLMRPALYQARHQIIPVNRRLSPSLPVDIVGPICETTDRFAEKVELPELEDGELLVMMEAGAYGSVLASNYNARRRSAEVLVDGNEPKLIRKRESLDDLVRHEII